MTKKILTSEKLYNINRQISLKCIGLNETLNLVELSSLNRQLGEIIKEIRMLEDHQE